MGAEDLPVKRKSTAVTDRFVAEAAVCSVHDRKHIYSGRTYVLFEEEVRPEYTGEEDGMNLERVERRERQINPQAVSRVASRAADEAARVSFIEEQAKKTRDQFEASFDWDDRKLMMSAQYWDMRTESENLKEVSYP